MHVFKFLGPPDVFGVSEVSLRFRSFCGFLQSNFQILRQAMKLKLNVCLKHPDVSQDRP